MIKDREPFALEPAVHLGMTLDDVIAGDLVLDPASKVNNLSMDRTKALDTSLGERVTQGFLRFKVGAGRPDLQ
jgi:hypothetical protein